MPTLEPFFTARAAQAVTWRAKNRYYYQWIARLLRFVLPPGQRVVEVGCGLGDLLAAVEPAVGVGIDFSPAMVALASRRHPQPALRFVCSDIGHDVGLRETFDAVIVSDLLGYLDDIQIALEHIRVLCHDRSRLMVTQYNRLWEPILHLGARLGLNQPKPLHNWLSAPEVMQLLALAGFDVVSRGSTFLCPKRLWGIGDGINRTMARLPLLRRFCLIQYFIARPTVAMPIRRYSVTVIVPVSQPPVALQSLVERLPTLGSLTEIILAVPADRANWRAVAAAAVAPLSGRRAIRVVPFAPEAGWWASTGQATGQLLLVLPADGSLDPGVLQKFYRVIAEANADVVVGSRLVYPSSLPWWRWLCLRWQSLLFSFISGQRVTDAACGAFALRRADAAALPLEGLPLTGQAGALPFLAAAAQRGLKIAEVPVHYQTPAVSQAADRTAARSTWLWWRCVRRHRW